MTRGNWWCEICRVGCGEEWTPDNPYRNCVICGRELEGKVFQQ